MVRSSYMSGNDGERTDGALQPAGQGDAPDGGAPGSEEAGSSPDPELARDEAAEGGSSGDPAVEGASGDASAGEPGPPPPASVPLPPPAYSPKISPTAEIADVMPGHGPTIGGTTVTIAGQHLFRESIVRFGGEIARTTGAREPLELKVEAPPANKPGPVDVTVQNPGAALAVLAGAFRYERLAPPQVSSVAPSRLASAGGEISITGKGFVAGSVVLLGKDEAAGVRFVDETTLEVKVPAGESGRYVDVAVKNPDGQQDVARRAFVFDDRYG
ncbi:MAG: IPT/TIG domain-containing protein [Deltaproteobacteria bacterium]|jgi:hypothetical protein|nr:IPT/TIG domain-containing protein [Deltaproteobacteria bacterium]MBW2536565.1 IPT/TIG domain-containing protein [Deltaproteobacteria bacterium]